MTKANNKNIAESTKEQMVVNVNATKTKRKISIKNYNEDNKEENKNYLKKKRGLMKIKRGSNVLWTEEEVNINILNYFLFVLV